MYLYNALCIIKTFFFNLKLFKPLELFEPFKPFELFEPFKLQPLACKESQILKLLTFAHACRFQTFNCQYIDVNVSKSTVYKNLQESLIYSSKHETLLQPKSANWGNFFLLTQMPKQYLRFTTAPFWFIWKQLIKYRIQQTPDLVIYIVNFSDTVNLLLLLL